MPNSPPNRLRIAFLTGCLEPAANGVGDYSRVLAQEVTRLGHECCLVALNDKHLSEPRVDRCIGNPAVSQLRLPSSMTWEERIAEAGAFLDEFAPDWVSLQFVSYGFNPKGVVRGLSRHLLRLTTGRRVHVMMHELWVGGWERAPLKERCVGALQCYYTLKMLRALRPAAIHTSNARYLRQLRDHGVNAARLPMFGAIPVGHDTADRWLFPLLQEQGIDVHPSSREQFWFFGFFGSLRGGWPSEPLFSHLRRAAHAQKRRIVILSAGRLHANGEWQKLAASYASEFDFVAIGEQSDERISEYLNSLDAGFSISQLSLVGKSSAVAAMLDHGLPVIVNRVDAALDAGHPSVIVMDQTLPDRLARGLARATIQASLPAAARQFTADLESATR